MTKSALSFLGNIGLQLSRPLMRFTQTQDIPERLIVKPNSPWPGCVTKGLYIIDIVEDDEITPSEWALQWLDFSFLKDLEAAGGYPARKAGRKAIFDYIQYTGRMPIPDDGLGARVCNMIMHADFILPEFDEGTQDLFFEHVIASGYMLVQGVRKNVFNSVAKINAAAGLIFAGLGFEGYEDWAALGIDVLSDELVVQFLDDGGHVSRSPAQTLEALKTLLDIRIMLKAAAYPTPKIVDETIKRSAQAVRFYRYHDKGFALFNGAQEGDVWFIDAVLAQAGARGKIPKSLPDSGFEKVSLGRATLMMTRGCPPMTQYDMRAHAAPLAFELCYGRERVFVSCGSHGSDEGWCRALRATAAHNTATLGGQDAYIIGDDGHFGYAHASAALACTRKNDAVLFEGHHEAYTQPFGFKHERRIYMSSQGHDIRGEDKFLCVSPRKKVMPTPAAVRFHVHPRVMVSMVQGGAEVLLRMPGGIGWRFSAEGCALNLEDSVYLGQGTDPRKTVQIVLHSVLNTPENIVRWGLKREG